MPPRLAPHPPAPGSDRRYKELLEAGEQKKAYELIHQRLKPLYSLVEAPSPNPPPPSARC